MMKKEEERSIEKEQLWTVTRLFMKEDIDLSLVKAGRSLYQSLRNAKHRTKKNKYYIAKGIMFNFAPTDRLALLEVIRGDKEFWDGWIKQHRVFDRTGLEADRPTLHRLDPDGHYEFGNIGILSSGDHLQENAVSMLIIDTDNLSINSYESITKMIEAEGVKQHKINAVRASKKKIGV